jgi:hypothetical protein
MKTAIKELIERIEKQMSAISDDPNLTERALYDSYFNCKNWAIELLEKEKEQIIDAMERTAMYVSAASLDKEIGKMTFEDLYNQTYNQNK